MAWPVGNDCVAATTQAALPAGGNNNAIGQNTRWFNSAPPDFANVVAVPGRLTYQEAVQLAQKSVFKCYRLINLDVFDYVSNNGRRRPINIPGYGALQRRQQVVLQDTQVDQIVPALGDQNIIDIDGAPITVNFYNGYSHDKPAVVFGSIASECYDNSPFSVLSQPDTGPTIRSAFRSPSIPFGR